MWQVNQSNPLSQVNQPHQKKPTQFPPIPAKYLALPVYPSLYDRSYWGGKFFRLHAGQILRRPERLFLQATLDPVPRLLRRLGCQHARQNDPQWFHITAACKRVQSHIIAMQDTPQHRDWAMICRVMASARPVHPSTWWTQCHLTLLASITASTWAKPAKTQRIFGYTCASSAFSYTSGSSARSSMSSGAP